MRPALATALLACVALAIGEDHLWPGAGKDEHDAQIAPPGSTLAQESSVPAVRPGRVSFAVKFKEEVSPFPVVGMFVMPGQQIPIEAVFTDSTQRYTAEARGGQLVRLGPSRWRWTAPGTKGLYPILVRDSISGETVTLNAFVLVPMPSAATIGGFLVGRYEPHPLRGDPSYARPAGFIEVTDANKGTLVAPHFTIGQFVSRQARGFPTYVVLRERLLLKLELLLEEVRSAGLPVSTFRIMSGYRTPFYNQSIGNETRYSRHVYGDAADIYVDEDGDGGMDDLDRDGRVTLEDARTLGAVIESLSQKSWYQPFEGGLGLYQSNAAHGPFVHVDVRGHRARWSP